MSADILANTNDELPPLPVIDDVEVRHHPIYRGYAVSNRGDVWGCKNPHGGFFAKWRLLRGGILEGYRQVLVYPESGKRLTRKMHVLVLETFAGSRPSGMVCRHLDGCRTNNTVSNLAWGTVKENNADRERHGTTPRGELHSHAKLTSEDIVSILNMASNGCTPKEIAKCFGVRDTTIGYILRRKYWKHIQISEDLASKIQTGPAKGSRNGAAKLTADDVLEIRSMSQRGHKLKEIGERFGISFQQISRIIHRRRWGHV